MPPAVEARSPNLWAARELLVVRFRSQNGLDHKMAPFMLKKLCLVRFFWGLLTLSAYNGKTNKQTKKLTCNFILFLGHKDPIAVIQI